MVAVRAYFIPGGHAAVLSSVSCTLHAVWLWYNDAASIT